MSTPNVEQHRFEAEVGQVLSIVVHSLYSHREVFLRELISNASDALDKLAFRALTDKDLLGDDTELRIEIVPDTEARTLTVRDNGIGMTHDELVQNLGTIARSGSRQLVEALKQKGETGDLSLIGQFGVGFYAAFLVADRVTVTSRAAGATDAWRWESDASEGFTIEAASRDERGTDVVLHLKEDADDFLREWELRSLVRKYSDYVRFPIRLEVEQEKDGEKHKTFETVNQASALWTRPKAEITDEQYREFYKHLGHDWNDPLAWTHFKVEGTQELTGLLFVPSKAPLELFERTDRGIRLFVKRVFVMEDCEEILPEWLRFVHGVVDSQDLPLNVSREFLQQDRVTRAIRKQVVKKTLALLEELAAAKDDDRYATFWSEFGRILKEGVVAERDDHELRDQVAALLRYDSSHGDGATSLFDYTARMKPDQPAIYYVTGDSREACEHSPHTEALKKHGYEVLYMHDPIDEWVVQALPEFAEKPLHAASKGALELPESDAEKQAAEAKEAELKDVVAAVKQALGDRVADVRVSKRLTDSPACLVGGEHDLSPRMERILRASGRDVPEQKRTLELNPDHPIVKKLEALAKDQGKQDTLTRWSALLCDQALLAEGSMPDDPARLAREIADLMSAAD